MNTEIIKTEVQRLLFQETSELSRSEYRELLSDISMQCNDAIDALDQDEDEEEES